MSGIDTTIGTEIVNAIEQFEEELSRIGLQHASAEAYAGIIRDYAAALIDAHMDGVAFKVVDE